MMKGRRKMREVETGMKLRMKGIKEIKRENKGKIVKGGEGRGKKEEQ